MINHFVDSFKGKHSFLNRRSSKWKRVRKAFVHQNPTCAVCGTKKKIEVHHIKKFSDYPELELSYNNLITLCQRCHLVFGHLCSYHSVNDEIVYDAYVFRKKIKERP